MKQWGRRFWKEHGDRIVFMSTALILSIVFYFWMTELKETGKTILIGLAMLCYNKARSTNVVDGTDEEVK